MRTSGRSVPARVGTGTLIFSDADVATFAYAWMRARDPVPDQDTDPLRPRCDERAADLHLPNAMTPNFAATTNYQDLWWVAGGAEDGWGLNFARQGALLFATWYTYGTNGAPLWLSALAQRVGATNVCTGTLYRTSGPRYDAYDATKAISQQVGTATFTFADGNHAAFDYATNDVGGLPIAMQTKQITRFPAAAGGVVCRYGCAGSAYGCVPAEFVAIPAGFAPSAAGFTPRSSGTVAFSPLAEPSAYIGRIRLAADTC